MEASAQQQQHPQSPLYGPAPQNHESSRETSVFSTLSKIILALVIAYILRDYPPWRLERIQGKSATENVESEADAATGKERSLLSATSSSATTISTGSANASSRQQESKPNLTITHTTALSSDASPNSDSLEQPDNGNTSSNKSSFIPQQWLSSTRWIPFLPAVLVYLTARLAWQTLRLTIYHTLFAAEQFFFWSLEYLEQIALDLPSTTNTYLVQPCKRVSTILWDSVILQKLVPAITDRIFPAAVTVSEWTVEVAMKTGRGIKNLTDQYTDPVVKALTWVAIEFIHNPLVGIWKRLEVLSRSIGYSAKIYGLELWKDLVDLSSGLFRVSMWAWERCIVPLGGYAGRAGHVVLDRLSKILPMVGNELWSWILFPVGNSIVSTIRLGLAQPTLLAAFQLFWSKVTDQVGKVMTKLEDTNWLLALESVLTKGVQWLISVSSQVVSWTGTWLYFIVFDYPPQAIENFKMALEVTRPVFEWVVTKLVMVAKFFWDTAFMIAKIGGKVSAPLIKFTMEQCIPRITSTATWIYAYILEPCYSVFVVQVLARVYIMSEWVQEYVRLYLPLLGPMVSAIVSKMESVVMWVNEIVGNITAQVMIWMQEKLGPKFEVWKVQVAEVSDMVTAQVGQVVVDWAKKEKRE